MKEIDFMEEAQRKQEEDNNAGVSMSELFAKKRQEAEKALEERKTSGPNDNEVAARKARLQA